ncbi:DUF445 domain-containing protein [Pseudoramibacter alactolyticus]|jgi:uncharacterized membrane protein YheB (UPF0754 family)|uniref:DUF445 domain-containing protein n=1 Tax=Pseudoramibacter alactolyticus TaxID=113287 RepID=UPI0028F02B4F|nr:DUF445 family protein [Pseudoramibacter alactolyticus]
MLKVLAGPLIGALIGYITNYLAVRMLFFPKHPVYFFGRRLPFTPGAIPKRKDYLAKRTGTLIAETLITKDDIVARLTAPDFEAQMVARITAVMKRSLGASAGNFFSSEEGYAEAKNRIADALTDSIMTSVNQLDVAGVIAERGPALVRKKLAGTLTGVFVTDRMIASLTEPVGQGIAEAIAEKGPALIRREVDRKIGHTGAHTPEELLARVAIDPAAWQEAVARAYETLVREGVERLMAHISVSQIVEDKIGAMNVDELEVMVLSVMKKEFTTIVNLGALIGFILGILNVVV